MTTTAEKTEIRLEITIPAALFKDLEANVPAEKRDQFFTDLLERELRRERLKRVLKESAGAWKTKDHPELAEPDGVEKYVRRLRDTAPVRSWDELIADDTDE